MRSACCRAIHLLLTWPEGTGAVKPALSVIVACRTRRGSLGGSLEFIYQTAGELLQSIDVSFNALTGSLPVDYITGVCSPFLNTPPGLPPVDLVSA